MSFVCDKNKKGTLTMVSISPLFSAFSAPSVRGTARTPAQTHAVSPAQQSDESVRTSTALMGVDTINPEAFFSLIGEGRGEVYSPSGASLDVIGSVDENGILTSPEGEVLGPSYRIMFERMYSDFSTIAQNPDAAIDAGKDDYAAFVADAEDFAAQAKGMDRYGVVDIHISLSGRATAVMNDKFEKLNGNVGPNGDSQISRALDDLHAIKNWLARHRDDVPQAGDTVKDYATGQAVKDYEAQTGVRFADLASHAEMNEYRHRIARYTASSFGVNPLSYGEVDARFGVPGVLTFVDGTDQDGNRPQAYLPDMPV